MGKENDFGGFAQVDEKNFDWSFDSEEPVNPTPTPADIVADILADTSSPEDKTKIKLELEEDAKEKALLDEVFADFGEPVDPVDDENEADDTNPKKPVVKNSSAISTLEFLKEKGLVEYELKDGQEMTDELALELAEQGWEKALEDEVEIITKGLSAEAKGLLKIAASGSPQDVNNYLKTLVTQAKTGLTKDTDMTVEANQVLALTLELEEQEYDSEYIESHIQSLKDSGKLEAMAEKVAAKRVKKQAEETEAQVQAGKVATESRVKALKLQKEQLVQSLTSLSNVKGIVLNKKDKEILPDYINTPSVELQDGRVISKMQEDLFKALADPNKKILIGKLLLNDFDFSSVSNATITEYSKNIRANLENSKNNSEKTNLKTGSSQKPKRSLADMLGD